MISREWLPPKMTAREVAAKVLIRLCYAYKLGVSLLTEQYAGNEGSYAQQTLSNTAQSLQDGPENIAYDIGATVDRADEYKNESEGVAERFTAKVADWFSGARNDVEGGLEEGVERVEDAPENAMAAVGEGVGNVERFGEDVGEAVTDAPYDAMRKVGEGFEDVRQAGENVEQYGDNLGDAYQQGRDQEQYD